MKRNKLAILVPAAAIGMVPALTYAAAVDTEPTNNLFSGADTWIWQSDPFNQGQVDDDVDFFELTGFVPGSQVQITFELLDFDGPIRLEAFDTTQVAGNDVDLLSVLDSADLSGAPIQSDTLLVTIPANGDLGLKVSDLDLSSLSAEGYRITIQVLSVPAAAPIPIAGWPLIPVIGAAALAGLRRRQQRPEIKRAA